MYAFYDKKPKISEWLGFVYQYLSKELKKEFEASVTFSDNIRELNKKYRHIDSATDVLSFESKDPTNPQYIGDIVLSAQDIDKYSQKYDQTFNDELIRCIVHGTLHLLGLNHESPLLVDENKITTTQKEEMFIIQEKLLSQILNGNSIQKIQKQDI